MTKKIIVSILILLTLLSTQTLASTPATRMNCVLQILNMTELSYADVDLAVLNNFTDKDEISPDIAPQIAAAISLGMINGYTDNTLRLSQNITRAEFAAMLYRFRDLITSPIKHIDYSGSYTDMADWNRDAIIWCMENGFMLGYGNNFGSNDNITTEQTNIVTNRVRFGLTTREKYSLLEICNQSPIPFTEIKNIVYGDSSLLTPSFAINETYERHYIYSSPDSAKLLETRLELMGNLSYDTKEAYTDKIKAEYTATGRNAQPLTVMIKENGVARSIDDIAKKVKADKVKRESIFVFSPINSYSAAHQLPGAYHRTCGVGYEYFRYVEGDILPEGVELGRWYRQRVEAQWREEGTEASLILKRGNSELFQ